jgi:hypothetical protein
MRFTIRDVLWLMVVVGLAFGWALSASLQNRLHQREHKNSFDRLVKVALKWAKETEKPVVVDAGGAAITDHPNGQYEVQAYAYPEPSN